uniref:Pyruvate decarboxylase n=1 Tax=Fusarium oxysporum (strain Fo5176) TaxID=660025 RepID=A0A0D2Y6Q3_FUSOF
MESGLLLEYPPVRLNSMSYKTTYLRDITEISCRYSGQKIGLTSHGGSANQIANPAAGQMIHRQLYAAAGTRRVYGVPGDFTLRALDHLPPSGLKFVGCCNELNAGYAADGYARAQRHRKASGVGALITTYGVGELSAANAVAGSYAEYLPVVHIVGTPSRRARQVSCSSLGGKKPHLHIHHTMADSRIGVYREIAEKFTVAQLDLAETTPEDVPTQIDRVLSQALHHSRPVYIEMPSDVVETGISSEKLNDPIDPNPDTARNLDAGQMAQNLLQKLYSAKRPLIIVDRAEGAETIRQEINDFVQKSGIPTISLPSGASMVDNSLPNYFGVYSGAIGAVDLTSAVKSADLVLAFGCQFSDTQTLGWAVLPERHVMTLISRNHIEDEPVDVREVLKGMAQTVDSTRLPGQDTSSWGDFRNQPQFEVYPKAYIIQDEFYIHLNKHLQPNDTVLLGNATPIIGGRDLVLPPSSQLIASGMWFSIGHMLPAALGVSQAKAVMKSKGRTILLDGDGSFQMTAQELSTIIHQRVNVIIFIINNSGYTYERYIHGMNEAYNDVAPWNYSAAPQLFGDAPEGYPIHSCKVSNMEELDEVLNSEGFVKGKGLTLVDVEMDMYDISEKAKILFELAGKQL